MAHSTKNQPHKHKLLIALCALGFTTVHPNAFAMAKKPKEKDAEVKAPTTPVETKSTTPAESKDVAPVTAPAAVPAELNTLAEKALKALKTKDGAALAKLVDPKKGVRFVPYTTFSKEDIILMPKDVATMFSSKKKYTWGVFDGSGEPIQMTPSEYYNKFIWNADYTTAKDVNWNTFKGTGNSLENQKQFHPKAQTVEYYFPGFEEKYAGIDWSALRLVFEQEGNDWFLVGIAHNQHTI